MTNFSINKKADNYKKNKGDKKDDGKTESTAEGTNDEAEMSSKWSLQELRAEYDRIGLDYDEIFKNVKLLCIKTLMAVEPQITTAMRAAKNRN